MNVTELEAGRALDERIAGEVMGEPRPAKPSGRDTLSVQLAGSFVWSDKGHWREVCVYSEGDVPRWIPRPFSSSIEEAWEVVEKMRADGWGFQLSDERAENGGLWCAEFESPDGTDVFSEWCETAPAAICVCALAALESRTDTERQEEGNG